MVFSKKSLVRCAALVTILLTTVSAQTETSFNYWTMKAYGANLGSWLSLERWIQPSLFENNAPDAIDEWTFSEQAANPAEALGEHWRTFITEDDIRILASINGNHLRVPVGYWAFITPDEGEPYIPTGQKPHLERLLGYCATYNIHAIIDLHGMPGSQNGEHHSGRTGEIEFYTDYNQERSVRTIQAVVDWMNTLNTTLRSRISAIQPVNEPHIETAAEFEILKRFYLDSYDIIQASPYKVAMLFHDGFQGLSAYSDFLLPPSNAVIDLHPYHAFPPQYNQTEIIENICEKTVNDESFHLPVFYGEWSLSSGVANNDDWFRIMMDTQVYAYKNGGVGFTFWTLKNNAVRDDYCDDPQARQLYYDCFEGITWSILRLVAANIVNERTFLDTPNQQCEEIENPVTPTTVTPITVAPTNPTQAPNSAIQARSNAFLLMVCLIVWIKIAMHMMQ